MGNHTLATTKGKAELVFIRVLNLFERFPGREKDNCEQEDEKNRNTVRVKEGTTSVILAPHLPVDPPGPRRVQRQVVLEDGRIVADTGPQVITRTTEDVNTENTEAGRNRADIPEEENDDSLSQSDTSVVRSITETRTTRKSASKEVNHYHDEERREITSPEELVIGMNSPQELLERIDNEFPEEIKGKLMFYSSKSKGLVCKEKVNEISRLDCNGNLRTVTTHTRHEEETTEDELPEQHVPSALPDLGSSGHAEWPQFGDNVLVIPISQKPCYKTAAHPSSKSGSSSNGAFSIHSDT